MRDAARRRRGVGASLLALLPSLLLLLACVSATVTASTADSESVHTPRIGVPLTSFQRSAVNHVGPRFHRLLKPEQDRQAKAQTAIFFASQAGVLGALNPRNGDVVWRRVINGTDQVHSFVTHDDMMLALTGSEGASRATLFQGLTGGAHWSVTFNDGGSPPKWPEWAAAGCEATFLASTSVSGDAIVMSSARTVRRLNTNSGGEVWSWTLPAADLSKSALVRVLASGDGVYAVALTATEASGISALTGGKQTLSLEVFQLSATSGAQLAHFQPASAISLPHNISGYADEAQAGGAADVAVVGLEATRSKPTGGVTSANTAPPLAPHAVWLQKDGTLAAKALTNDVERPTLSLSPRASRFVALKEVGLGEKGLLVAIREDGHSEIVRVQHAEGAAGKKAQSQLKSVWEHEEEAFDAIYSGSRDRQGSAYINRVFFSSPQKLLHVHTLWADAYDGQGQVTGFSFQWDHDLNGDILAAPFEASPVSQHQLITRTVFVTASGSIRMVQDERHQWIREEGLSETVATALVDLPESSTTSSASGAALAAALTSGAEPFLDRVTRHLLSLAELPSALSALVHRGIELASQLGSSGDAGAPRPPAQPKPNVPKSTGRPLGGVAAAEPPPIRVPPPGVPPSGGRRGSKTRQGVDEPAPPPSLANRTATPERIAALARDKHGFRKIIVSATRRGKLYALDSATQAVVWEKSLIGFGQGEGGARPRVDVRFLALTRGLSASAAAAAAETSADDTSGRVSRLHQQITVIAEIREGPYVVTRAWTLDPVTGEFPDGEGKQTGLPLWPGPARDVFLMPIEDPHTGQQVVGCVFGDEEPTLLLHPDVPGTQSAFQKIADSFFYSLPATLPDSKSRDNESANALVGYVQDGPHGAKSTRAWQVALPPGHVVARSARPGPQPVASQGRVLSDRATLYKLLEPTRIGVISVDESRRAASLLVVDTARGEVLYETVLTDGDLAEDASLHLILQGNWLVAAFAVSAPSGSGSDGRKRRETRLVSVELYDGARDASGKAKWRSRVSRFEGGGDGEGGEAAVAFTQTFTAPFGIRALGVTRTKFGVATTNLIVATDTGTVALVPRRLLDPRRPVGRKPTTEELEEGLLAYDALLPSAARLSVGSRFVIEKLDGVVAAPTSLESTSVVVAYGLDAYVTRVHPSGRFDVLAPRFGKAQLLLVTAGLAVGYVATRPMLSARALKARWQ